MSQIQEATKEELRAWLREHEEVAASLRMQVQELEHALHRLVVWANAIEGGFELTLSSDHPLPAARAVLAKGYK